VKRSATTARTAAARPRAGSHESLRDARLRPFWLDTADAPPAAPPLSGEEQCDLAVVGGGFSGLWAAVLAKERDPSRHVVVLESVTCGWAASGRNGGFCMATLTHGASNGIARFPKEQRRLEELGVANLDAIGDAVERHGIACDWQRTGEVSVATEQWQVDSLREEYELLQRLGRAVRLLDRDEIQAEVHSPTYLGALWEVDGCAMADPARLAWGLRRACLDLGVRLYEGTPVLDVGADGAGVALLTPGGRVLSRQAVLATNAFKPLLRRVRPYIVPVYDYALMTEPLSSAQREAIGWTTRAGLADAGNQFHYYRTSEDGRLLWGGYDAVYHYGNRIHPALDARPETFEKLARQFFETFPQLEGLRFSHAWGGAIDTCSRFFSFWGTALRERVAYVLGYTGMGVAESRFGAEVCLDLLSGQKTELTELELVRTRPVPFPPEPFRAAAIELTRRSLARADEQGGRRDLWLRTLDRFGLGFDS
jgi:glycine/D-amino acid oxidase-like deaminating enzyme